MLGFLLDGVSEWLYFIEMKGEIDLFWIIEEVLWVWLVFLVIVVVEKLILLIVGRWF